MLAVVLRHRFIVAPDRLSLVVKRFAGLDKLTRFYIELVDEYLPEERPRLLALNPTDAAARYIRVFSTRYFPLAEPVHNFDYRADDSLTARLLSGIPIEWHGMETYRYDTGRVTSGHLVAGVSCRCPLPRTLHRVFNGGDARLALVDRFINKAGEAVKPLVPETGYSLQRLSRALKDAPWPGLLPWCRWLFSRTGCERLDRTPNEYGHTRTVGWTREDVDRLTLDWPLYQKMSGLMRKFSDWLDEDFPARSAEVLRWVGEKMKRKKER